MTDKPTLRAKLRAARDAFAALGRAIDVPDPFRRTLATAASVATYRPVGGEADPSALDLAVLASGGQLALPHVIDRASPMRFLHWQRDLRLVAGPFGLQQPVAEAAEVAPEIILTPLVGFDRRGNRLGQGAGHYDRAFAAHPDALRIGVAWSVQEIKVLLADPWDVPLHAVVTEKEWIWIRDRTI